MTPQREISILLVEDNDFDVRRIERAISKIGVDLPLFRAMDGQDALEMLRGGVVARPLVILLDINMPRMNGIEFLRELRHDPAFSTLPVHVITTSDYYRDISAVYEHGVSGYYVKPATGQEMTEITRYLLHLATISHYPEAPVN